MELCCRVFNLQLEHCRLVWGLIGKTESQFGLNNHLITLKQEVPELSCVHAQVLQNISHRISKSMAGFFNRVDMGIKAGLPRFKCKERYRSMTYPQYGFELKEKLALSKIGEISIRKHRELRGVLKTLTIKKTATNKWFGIFTTEHNLDPRRPSTKETGLDLGIQTLAALSDGTVIQSARRLEGFEPRLNLCMKRLSRNGDRARTGRRAGSL